MVDLSYCAELLDSVPDAVVIIDDLGKIVMVNRQTESLFGWKKGELTGEKMEILMPERFRKKHPEHRESYFHSPHVRPMGSMMNLFAINRSGKEFPVEISLSPLRGQRCVVASIRDVSDRIKLLENLKEQNKKLENFSHIISHNLRSPVGNLGMLLKFLKEEKSSKGRTFLIEKLEKNICNLSETLNKLLEVIQIKIESKRNREKICFMPVYQKICESLEGEIMETHANISADFSRAEEVEYLPVYLESIIQNLLSNALKYRHPKRIPQIQIETYRANSSVILSVRDNGLGIDLGCHREKIFGLHKTFHEHPDARGVGLFITRTQVEALGGKITLMSKVGEGTVFLVRLN
ncbi:MAG: PAS domain-containing sensor histidine kinase [Bacteroidia bacterium]